jgi:hypothetical protein
VISPFHDASQEVRTFFYLIARFPFFFSSLLPLSLPSHHPPGITTVRHVLVQLIAPLSFQQPDAPSPWVPSPD